MSPHAFIDLTDKKHQKVVGSAGYGISDEMRARERPSACSLITRREVKSHCKHTEAAHPPSCENKLYSASCSSESNGYVLLLNRPQGVTQTICVFVKTTQILERLLSDHTARRVVLAISFASSASPSKWTLKDLSIYLSLSLFPRSLASIIGARLSLKLHHSQSPLREVFLFASCPKHYRHTRTGSGPATTYKIESHGSQSDTCPWPVDFLVPIYGCSALGGPGKGTLEIATLQWSFTQRASVLISWVACSGIRRKRFHRPILSVLAYMVCFENDK